MSMNRFESVFRAKLTGRTEVSGIHRYDWTELSVEPDGTDTDSGDGRFGGDEAGFWAMEINNREIETTDEPVVLLKVRTSVDHQLIYEFDGSGLFASQGDDDVGFAGNVCPIFADDPIYANGGEYLVDGGVWT